MKNKSFYIFCFTVVTAVILFILMFFAPKIIKTLALKSKGDSDIGQTFGTVTSYKEINNKTTDSYGYDSSSTEYEYIITFKVDGRTYHTSFTESIYSKKFIGSVHTVYYSISNPEYSGTTPNFLKNKLSGMYVLVIVSLFVLGYIDFYLLREYNQCY